MSGERAHHTDTVGEWVAVLETIVERETHPYRRGKVLEVIDALRANRHALLTVLDEAA